jgi:four helix bundle protein
VNAVKSVTGAATNLPDLLRQVKSGRYYARHQVAGKRKLNQLPTDLFAPNRSAGSNFIANLRFQISDLKSAPPMPTYQRFEDLPVWQTAADLYDHVDDLLAAAPPRLSHSFRDQLERAALSVSNNIAEGFERGTTNELLAFLYISRGSAGEVRSMLILLGRRQWIPLDLRSQISDLKSLAESCSRQLRAWADSLQNSDIAGPRHLNEKTRVNYQKTAARKQGVADFKALLAQHLPPDHPARKI